MSEIDARVVSEPRVYSRDGHHSFLRDQLDYIGLNDEHARRRLERHQFEVEHEVGRETPEGRRALRERTSELRNQRPWATQHELEREVRAGNATTIAGFTTPQWIIEEFAVARSTQRTFADQCLNVPLSGVGMQVNIPRFTAVSSAGIVSEGTAVPNADPTGLNLQENVQTISGTVTVSQQLVDRTRNQPSGAAFDIILYEQLKDDYAQALNGYVIQKSINLGSTVPGAATFTNNALASLYGDVATAREKLTDTAGVRLQPTHIFTTPDLFSYMSRQLDDQHRPIITPTLAPGVPPGPIADTAASDEAYKWAQFTGTTIPGLLFWFIDATLPSNGSQTPIVVARPDKIVLFEGEPILRAFPETVGQNLQVVVQHYNYAACLPRYPGATSTIYGAAYTTALV